MYFYLLEANPLNKYKVIVARRKKNHCRKGEGWNDEEEVVEGESRDGGLSGGAILTDEIPLKMYSR